MKRSEKLFLLTVKKYLAIGVVGLLKSPVATLTLGWQHTKANSLKGPLVFTGMMLPLHASRELFGWAYGLMFGDGVTLFHLLLTLSLLFLCVGVLCLLFKVGWYSQSKRF